MTQKFKTGDVVKLKSGGPDMTISGYQSVLNLGALMGRKSDEEIGESQVTKCTWFDGKKPMGNSYHEDLLDLVRSSAE
jgi:uncharacterized protein YodC (DUF2158 family)